MNRKFYRSSVAFLAGALLTLAFGANASTDLIKTLQEKDILSEAEASELLEKLSANVSTKGGIKIGSTDRKYSVKVGGRIMYDYNRAELNGVADEDQFDLRRGRIFFKGNVGNDWSYKSQFNVNGSGPEDLYIRYKGFDAVDVTVGRQKMPFGLEELTSSKDISMLERSAATEAYVIGRADGVVLFGQQGDITYALGAYGEDSAADPNLEDFGYAARVTAALINEGDTVLHMGAAYRALEGDNSVLGFELAGVLGPLHAQAEFFDADQAGVETDAYYVQVGYVLTGETRPYKAGKFKRVKPTGNNGALELVLRYEDGEADYGDIELGSDDASAYGIGLNWYVTNAVKIGVNYTDGDSNTNDDEGEEFRTRFQLTF